MSTSKNKITLEFDESFYEQRLIEILHDTNDTQGQGIAKVNWVNDRILIAPQGYGNEWNVGNQTRKANDVA